MAVRWKKGWVALLLILVSSVVFVYQTAFMTDVHQLSSFNTEEHPHWRSVLREAVENVFMNTVKWFDNRPDPCQDCLTMDFTEIIQPRNICSEGDNPSILINVITTAGEQRHRSVLRKTWLRLSNQKGGDVRHIFMVGTVKNETLQRELLTESVQYGDILQNDFGDSYRNLTIKSLAGMKWSVRNCPHAKYLLKVDSDIFLNLPMWQNLMFGSSKDAVKNVVFGHCDRTPLVSRTPGHKYRVPVSTYPHWRFPSFCYGPAFAMSGQIAKEIVDVSYKQPYLSGADAYIGVCLKALGRKVYNPPHLNMYVLSDMKGKIAKNPCFVKNEVYVIHKVGTNDLLQLWQKLSLC